MSGLYSQEFHFSYQDGPPRGHDPIEKDLGCSNNHPKPNLSAHVSFLEASSMIEISDITAIELLGVPPMSDQLGLFRIRRIAKY